MSATRELAVTRSAELQKEMDRQSADLDVPVEWLAAGLVCDTIEEYRPS